MNWAVALVRKLMVVRFEFLASHVSGGVDAQRKARVDMGGVPDGCRRNERIGSGKRLPGHRFALEAPGVF